MALIIFGSYFLLNIALAVVWEAFSSLNETHRKRMEELNKPQAKNRDRTATGEATGAAGF